VTDRLRGRGFAAVPDAGSSMASRSGIEIADRLEADRVAEFG
jgi:hypothetical protein